MPHPKRPAPVEFSISEENILKADDPRPQYVPQYPSSPRRRPLKKQEEAIPTSIFDTEADQEMQAQYGMGDGQHKPAFLYVERGPGMGQLLEVKQGSVVVGRASVADLRIQHPSVSRRHCQIRRVGEQFFVKDLGSQNGTFVNKQRIATETEAKPGDTIALGNALVRLRGPLTKGERLPHQKEAPAPAPAPVARAEAPARPSPRKIEVEERNKRVSTAVVARPSGLGGVDKNNNLLKIAIFLGALVIGLMIMLVIALVMSFRSQQPVIVKEVPAGPPALSAPLPPSERDRIIQEALAKKMAEVKHDVERKAAAEAAPAAEQPTVEASAPVVVVRREAPVVSPPVVKAAPAPAPFAAKAAVTRAPHRAAAVAAASEDEDQDSAPAKGGGAKRAQLLASYEKGNAEGSLDAAKKAGDKDLVQKLTAFLTAYDAANEAMASNNGTQAIVSFQKALSLDEQLSNGWGKYGAEIRKHLANLYTLVGMQYASAGQPENARKAFQGALKHDPTNARAKAQLEKLGDSGDGEEAPAPKAKPAPKKAAKNSIDDAFGD